MIFQFWAGLVIYIFRAFAKRYITYLVSASESDLDLWGEWTDYLIQKGW